MGYKPDLTKPLNVSKDKSTYLQANAHKYQATGIHSSLHGHIHKHCKQTGVCQRSQYKRTGSQASIYMKTENACTAIVGYGE